MFWKLGVLYQPSLAKHNGSRLSSSLSFLQCGLGLPQVSPSEPLLLSAANRLDLCSFPPRPSCHQMPVRLCCASGLSGARWPGGIVSACGGVGPQLTEGLSGKLRLPGKTLTQGALSGLFRPAVGPGRHPRPSPSALPVGLSPIPVSLLCPL